MNLNLIATLWSNLIPGASEHLTKRLLAGVEVDIDGLPPIDTDPYATVWLDPFDQRVVVATTDDNASRPTFNPDCLEVVRSLDHLCEVMGDTATLDDAARLRDLLVEDGVMVWRYGSGWMLILDEVEWVDYLVAATRIPEGHGFLTNGKQIAPIGSKTHDEVKAEGWKLGVVE